MKVRITHSYTGDLLIGLRDPGDNYSFIEPFSRHTGGTDQNLGAWRLYVFDLNQGDHGASCWKLDAETG